MRSLPAANNQAQPRFATRNSAKPTERPPFHGMTLRQAALDLVHTFGLEPAPAGTEKRNG
jgi:hypothetical protein